MQLHRRTCLQLLAASVVGLASSPARAASRVRSIDAQANGTTLWLELDAAPFPHGSAGYQDRTVIVFVPKTFRAERGARAGSHGHTLSLATRAGARVPLLVHFHGHNTTAERAIVSHALREQLVDSKQNAVLVVPQGPVNASDSSAGKLDAPGGLARMLDEVLRMLVTPEVKAALGFPF